MGRPQRKKKQRKPEIEPAVWLWLLDESGPTFEVYFLMSEEELEDLWRRTEADVLRQYISMRPGHRPSQWYRYSAPRGVWRGQFHEFTQFEEPRLILNRPSDLIMSHDVTNAFCMPFKAVWRSWYRTDHVGELLDYAGVDYYALDSVIVESEPQYLQRLNLLTPEEERKLLPADFEPVSVAEVLREREKIRHVRRDEE